MNLKHLTCFLLFFFLLSCQTLVPPPSEEIEEKFSPTLSQSLTPEQTVSLRLTQEGEEALLRGSMIEASNTFAKAIDLDPSNGFAYYFLGEINFQKGKYHQSLTFLEKAEGILQKRSHWLSKIYSLMGINYETMIHLKKAQQFFELALIEDKKNIIAREGLSRILKRDQNTEKNEIH
jgi:tetratricopeptide (TPR) repeat protein